MLLDVSDYREYDGMISKSFSVEYSSINAKFWVKTLVEEMKPVIVEK